MDLNRKYIDVAGNECSILGMVQREPEWAANCIQEGEKSAARIAELESDARIMAKLLYKLHRNCDCPACIIAAKYREG